jgi:DNA-binding NarL/FixJ family response regulator
MTDDTAIRVLVCDDHPLFRRAVITTLEDAGMHVVAEADNGPEAVIRAIDHAPDVIVMDLRMPGGNGIDATDEIRRARPWSRILVLTVSDDLDELLASMRAGAIGHLRKEESMGLLPDAVRAVYRGGVVLGPALMRGVRLELDRLSRQLETHGSAHGPASWRPTGRQLQLLDLVAGGMDAAEAAAALGLDRAMVRTELRNALEGLRRLSAIDEASATPPS